MCSFTENATIVPVNPPQNGNWEVMQFDARFRNHRSLLVELCPEGQCWCTLQKSKRLELHCLLWLTSPIREWPSLLQPLLCLARPFCSNETSRKTTKVSHLANTGPTVLFYFLSRIASWFKWHVSHNAIPLQLVFPVTRHVQLFVVQITRHTQHPCSLHLGKVNSII